MGDSQKRVGLIRYAGEYRTAPNLHDYRMSTDCRYIIDRDYPRIPVASTQSDLSPSQVLRQQEYDYALYDIDARLKHQSNAGRTQDLNTFGLPAPATDFDRYAEEANRWIREEFAYDHTVQSAQEGLNALNREQRRAADSIIDAVDRGGDEFGNGSIFFLNGPGGTGKTRVQNASRPVFVPLGA